MKLIQVQKSDEILEYLKLNNIINLNIIGKIENNSELPIYTDNPKKPNGVLVISGYMHYLYTESDAFIDAVLNQHMKEGFFGFSGLDIKIAEKIKSKNIVQWNNRCSIYTYNEKQISLVDGEYDLRPIDLTDAKIVNEFYEYSNPGSLHDIERDIKFRPSSAVYVNNEPVCWVLVHEDNSMGIMYTKEEHRRKGLAEVVSRDLTRRMIEIDQIPYLQIVDGNTKSHGLAKKCGYEKFGDCEWFGIITGHPKEISEGGKEVLKSFEEAYGHPRFTQEQELEVEYFILHRQEEVDESYSVRVLGKDDVFDDWSNLIEPICGVTRPSETMEAWLIELNGTVIGAALLQVAEDPEDYMLHAFELTENANMKDAVHTLIAKVKEKNKYFVCTVIEKEKSFAYEAASFITNGPIEV